MEQSSCFLPIVKGSSNWKLASSDKGASNEVQVQTKRKPKKKSPKKKKKAEDYFWYNATDTIEMNETYLRCTVRGNPQPLKRHRTSRGFTYNPSAAAQDFFRKAVQDQCDFKPTYDLDEKDNLVPISHFGSDVALKMRVIFYLQRPLSHFVSNRRGNNRLKPDPAWKLSRRVDIDNLAKFVLDSLNEVLYGDDQQIVVLECTKCYDTQDECLGKTELQLEVLHNMPQSSIILQE